MPYRGSRERNIVMCKCCAKLDETINDIQIKFLQDDIPEIPSLPSRKDSINLS